MGAVYRRTGIGVRPGGIKSSGSSVGIAALSTGLTINGVTEYPIISLKGGDANASTWNAWNYGPNFTALGSGGLFNQTGPGSGHLDYHVDPQGTRYYEDATSGNLGTDDFVVEAVIQIGTTGRIAAKRSATPDAGWDFVPVTGALWFFIKDGTVAANNASAVLGAGWHHVIGFGDRSGSFQWYSDGAASGAATVISGVGDIDSSVNVQIGSQRGLSIGDHLISYFRLWKRAAWLDTHLQASLALERYNAYSGS